MKTNVSHTFLPKVFQKFQIGSIFFFNSDYDTFLLIWLILCLASYPSNETSYVNSQISSWIIPFNYSVYSFHQEEISSLPLNFKLQNKYSKISKNIYVSSHPLAVQSKFWHHSQSVQEGLCPIYLGFAGVLMALKSKESPSCPAQPEIQQWWRVLR